MKKYKGKFIGPYRIDKIDRLESKTFLGKPRVRVWFKEEKGGKGFPHKDYPEVVLEQIVTDKESDLSQLRIDRVIPVVEKILVELTEAELTLPEINFATGPRLKASIDQSILRANKKLWDKAEDEVTLKDIDNVLKKK